MVVYGQKKILFAFAFFLLFCLKPAYAGPTSPVPGQQSAGPGDPPSIQVVEPDFNFGEIIEGTAEITHDFTVKNTGKGVLKIERVQAG